MLRLDEVPVPEPGPRDVRIRVCATSVNPVDWKIRQGGQRNIIRYRLPWILGLDVSGVVDAVGARVTRFRVGDEVWSSPVHTRPGAYAEHMCIDEREVGPKPRSIAHEEAASMPLVGLTAYQCIVEKGKLRRGQRVLVHAGAGGVGSFAIQLAKHVGAAEIVTTCSARNTDFVRSLGADRVIDYTKERFEDVVRDLDLVLDSVGEPAFAAHMKVVRRGGRISNITLDVSRHVERWGSVVSLLTLGASVGWMHVWPLVRHGIVFRHVIKRCDGEQLGVIAKLVDEGAIKPVIDRVFPLAAIADAHRLSESHHARGKIVVRVAEP
ncbi:MAG: NADP-dependent oxidoreductase [Deltaproteobacteria bacterium]|nr:NADP-dependent oxidoreductase [Deltaproteobacteria bacterium]